MRVVAKTGTTIYTVELSQAEADLLAGVLLFGVEFTEKTKLGKFAEDLWSQLTDEGASEDMSVTNPGTDYLVQKAAE